MSRASSEALDGLHKLIAETLANQIKNGVTKMNKDGEEVVEDVPAAVLAVAVKFLKDNGIEALPTQGTPLGNLVDSLPFPTKPSIRAN